MLPMRRATLLLAILPSIAIAQPDSRDAAIGKQLAQEVERQSTVVADPAIADYANRLGQKMEATLSVKVLADERPHAEAFPGASCYVTTGLILTAASEAELAGAIAHALGHVALWHDQQAMRFDATIGQIPLIWYASCLRWDPHAGLAIPVGFIARQAELESQADQLGMGYMDKAGYDPGALADLFERLATQGKRTPSIYKRWLVFPASTRTKAEALRAQRRDYVVTTSEFREFQQRVASLPPAAPRVGGPTLLRGH